MGASFLAAQNPRAEAVLPLLDYSQMIEGWTVEKKRCAFLTGKERDPESANDYFGARYYFHGNARWLSVDPVAGDVSDPRRLNRYSYVLNDPVNYIDPDGGDPVPFIRITVTADLPSWESTPSGLPGRPGMGGRAPFAGLDGPHESFGPNRPWPLNFGEWARNALGRRLKRTGEGCKNFLSQKMGAGWAPTMQTDAKSTTFYNPENIAGIKVTDLPGVTGNFNYTYLSEAWEKAAAAGADGMVVTNTDGEIFRYAVIQSGLNVHDFEESVFGEQLHITTKKGDVDLFNTWGLGKLYNVGTLTAQDKWWASKWLHEFLNNDCKKRELP